MNIQETWVKIKSLSEDAVAEWGLIAIVFLATLSAFGLGRLSALEEARPPVAILQASESAAPREMVMGGMLVASKKGSTYYFPWCSGASAIAPQNQVWYTSEAAAKKAGLKPAKNCKGLQQ